VSGTIHLERELATDVGQPPAQRERRLRGTVVGLGIGLAVLLLGLATPYVFTHTYTMSLLLEVVLLSMLALSVGFLARHLGMISLGHIAFFGGAAYAYGIAIMKWGWSPGAAFVSAIVIGTLIAVVMGVLVVRLTGMGFLMLTLALSQALYQLCIQTSMRPITGAHDGLLIVVDRDSRFFGLTPAEVMNPGLFWPLAWVALVLCALLLWVVGRSRFGTVLEGIRENEERMRFSGFGTFLPRLAAFVLSGFVASVGGALFAVNAGYVSPELLGFGRAGDSLIAAIVGGLGSLVGPVIGTFLFVYAQATFNLGGNLPLLMGISLVLVLAFLPGGITGTAGRLYRRFKPFVARRFGGSPTADKESR